MPSTCASEWSTQMGLAQWCAVGTPAQTAALAARECSKHSAESRHLEKSKQLPWVFSGWSYQP